jgi:FkbM family methyltransferase
MVKFIGSGLRALLRVRREKLAKARAADVAVLLNGEAIALLDVGASGGIIPRWYPHREHVAFIGVEPDARSIPALLDSPDASAFKSYEIIPSGVWNQSGTVSISFTRKPMCSSHFTPNLPFLSRFLDVDRFDIVGSGQINCLTVDDLLASSGKEVDFIKLDLEGGELAVLEGAVATMRSCIGMHVEVSFQSLRENQPLFGDVARFLQQHGLEFIDFVSLLRWERGSYSGTGQAIFADSLFLRAPENLVGHGEDKVISARKARVYLAILTIYERFDLALKFLELMRSAHTDLSVSEIDRSAAVIQRRKANFDRRHRMVSLLGRTFARYAGPDYGLHYIY